MKRLKPTFEFESVFCIDTEFLRKHDIKCVLFDIDNTLIANNKTKLSEVSVQYISSLIDNGIKVCLVSNNKMSRISGESDKIGFIEINRAKKPFPFKINSFLRENKIEKRNTILVGDQIFTDILAGNNVHIKTALVEPIDLTLENTFFKLKRLGERLIARRKFKHPY